MMRVNLNRPFDDEIESRCIWIRPLSYSLFRSSFPSCWEHPSHIPRIHKLEFRMRKFVLQAARRVQNVLLKRSHMLLQTWVCGHLCLEYAVNTYELAINMDNISISMDGVVSVKDEIGLLLSGKSANV
ncbi:hypothetical protein ACET3Z_009114 [Daucus carota]